MEPKHVTLEKMEAMLEQLSTKIEELAARSTDHQRIDDLKVWRAETWAKLEAFRALGHEKWEGIEEELTRAWSDLGRTLEDLGRNPGRGKR